MSSGPYSYEVGKSRSFHTADYAVFGSMLVVSASIGIFYAIKDRKKNTPDEYLLAGRSMNPIPVAMSLLSTFTSSGMMIGVPAETLAYTAMYWWTALAFVITVVGAAHVYVPVFFKLGVDSVFQYVEMRFCLFTKLLCCALYIVLMTSFIAVITYTPSLVLNAVTGLSLWGTVVVASLVCTFYTTIGGMKAVLWADTVQMTLIFVGMLVLVIMGTETLGGIGNVWETAKENGRLNIDIWDPDPRIRYSIWNTVIGGGIFWMALYGTNQAQVQRALSVRNLTSARIALWLTWPGFITIVTLVVLLGIVMSAFYNKCDPVKFGLVSKPDQVVPLITMDLLGKYHGVPGLFLASIFSGTLSSVSSGYNALSLIILEDFIRPFCCTKMTVSRAALISRLIVLCIGGLSLLLAYAASNLGSMVLQLILSLFGIFGGPVLGIYTLGMLFPWANKWGARAGLIFSTLLLLWIGSGAILTSTSVAVKSPVSVEGCNWNISDLTTMAPPTTQRMLTTTSIFEKYTGIQRFYTMSHNWYTGLGMLTVIVVGMLVSFATGLTDTKTLNPKLICPIFDIFFPCLPEKIRKPLRFGVRHEEATDEDEDRLKENIKYKKKMDCTVAVVSDLEKGTDNGLVNDGYVPPSYETNAVTTKL